MADKNGKASIRIYLRGEWTGHNTQDDKKKVPGGGVRGSVCSGVREVMLLVSTMRAQFNIVEVRYQFWKAVER